MGPLRFGNSKRQAVLDEIIAKNDAVNRAEAAGDINAEAKVRAFDAARLNYPFLTPAQGEDDRFRKAAQIMDREFFETSDDKRPLEERYQLIGAAIAEVMKDPECFTLWPDAIAHRAMHIMPDENESSSVVVQNLRSTE